MQNGTCALEIFKPLRKNEKGTWRLIQEIQSTKLTGCVFQLQLSECVTDAHVEALKSNEACE